MYVGKERKRSVSHISTLAIFSTCPRAGARQEADKNTAQG